ncbi:MAG: DNA/RNA nuclease SfsA [Candidatus Thorarchaeota archaeon]
MPIVGEVMKASLIDRPNRFLGQVKLGDSIVEAFIPNPGRMHELMVPGKTVYLRYRPGKHRKTDFDMFCVQHEGALVSIDSNLPNRFMKRLLEGRRLEMFIDYETVLPEPRMLGGRFDFKLVGQSGITFIEVKSCTLVKNGRAMFPDAPTVRGARHMRHLSETLKKRLASRAAVVFVIQRPDAFVFSPNDDTDPDFGVALREAHKQGVEVVPLLTEVKNWSLSLIGPIPFEA